MPDVVVADDISDVIFDLDGKIEQDKVSDFFQEEGDYEIIYPGFYGQALLDLRDSVTTVRKVIVDDTTVCYRFVYRTDTSLAPDYSLLY